MPRPMPKYQIGQRLSLKTQVAAQLGIGTEVQVMLVSPQLDEEGENRLGPIWYHIRPLSGLGGVYWTRETDFQPL